MSNFLGEVREAPVSHRSTSILSSNELMAREGIPLQKGMNFRKDLPRQAGGEKPSVFLVLPSHEGEYKDEWRPETQMYIYRGHDSTTIEAGGKSQDQLLMYGSDKLTENGKFYKAANEYKDGLRVAPLQIQVYEKLDPGVWYDKDIFDLVGARSVIEDERKIFKFDLRPHGLKGRTFKSADFDERMMPVTEKIAIWQRDNGRCSECGTEKGLRFVSDTKAGLPNIRLLCATHRGESGGFLG